MERKVDNREEELSNLLEEEIGLMFDKLLEPFKKEIDLMFDKIFDDLKEIKEKVEILKIKSELLAGQNFVGSNFDWGDYEKCPGINNRQVKFKRGPFY